MYNSYHNLLDFFENILTRLHKGDRDAFTSLYEVFAPKCAGFANAILHDGEAAADIVQDVFVKLWIKRASLRDINSVEAYLMNMTKYAVFDRCDKIKSYETFVTNFRKTRTEAFSGTEESIDAADLSEVLLKSVSLLSPARRKIFILSRYHGLDNDTIAALTGLSKRTVENHISDALAFLRKRIRRLR